MNAIVYPETEAARAVDYVEATLKRFPQVELPLEHIFTPGLYTRKIFMPKGTVVVSEIHKTEHPFVILRGKAVVWTEGGGVITLTAPHIGVTKPGTRRILRIEEDCEWATFHPTKETNLDKIRAELILDRPSTANQEFIDRAFRDYESSLVPNEAAA